MTAILAGVSTTLFLALLSAIYSFGRLKQTVDGLGDKIEEFNEIRVKVDDISTRLTTVEVMVGRRISDG